MNEQWNKIFPNRLYNGKMLVSEFAQFTDLGMNLVYSYAFMGLIALVLSATGLFTLASLNIVRRTKEIGVRKVLGATVFSITRMMNTEFVIILAVGSLLGSLYSYAWTNTIMGSIWKYYQGVNIWTFVAAIGLLFTVSLLTIGYKVFNVATMNPVDTLRDE
jgi:ABC-type antimicrobial peptide transport system permease subunit